MSIHSFSSNDTIKKLKKLLPESIHNQSVPKEVLSIIDDYIPKLNDKNIHQVVQYYLCNNGHPNNGHLKQQIINYYGQISNWDVSQVTNMKELFEMRFEFNEDISKWNVSKVTNMINMFCCAESFNQPLDNWDVSKVTKMIGMFAYAESFNQPLNNWNVSNVTNMRAMFYKTKSFNQPLNNWNVFKVIYIWGMFVYAENFNQHLKNWNWNVSNECLENLIQHGYYNGDENGTSDEED